MRTSAPAGIVRVMLTLTCLAALVLSVSAHVPGDSSRVEPPGLLLEARTARELGLGVRDTVRISSLDGREERFFVAGLYRRPADPSTATRQDYRAILHLPDLQRLLDAPDRVDRFSLRLRPGADAEAVRLEIDRLAFGSEAHPTEVVANTTSETFRVISRFHRALATITIFGSAIFLICLVVLKIEERRSEGAVMREIGVSRRTLFLWTFSETVLMAVIGTAVGLGLGWAGSYLINLYFRNFYATSLAFARVTPELGLQVAAIALATGLVIGVWAGWRMVRTAPARLRQP